MITPTRENIMLTIIVIGIISMADITNDLIQ